MKISTPAIFGLAYLFSELGLAVTKRSIDVAIAIDHQLVDTGPYHFLRHPSYTRALLAFLAFLYRIYMQRTRRLTPFLH